MVAHPPSTGAARAKGMSWNDKQAAMRELKDPVAYEMLKSIKTALDPDNLLNPGKLLM